MHTTSHIARSNADFSIICRLRIQKITFGKYTASYTGCLCYGLTARKVEGVGTQYIHKVNHVLRTIVIALTSQYPRREPSLYDYASRPSRESWELPPTLHGEANMAYMLVVPHEHIDIQDKVPTYRIEIEGNTKNRKP